MIGEGKKDSKKKEKKKDVTRVGLEPTLSFPNQDAC